MLLIGQSNLGDRRFLRSKMPSAYFFRSLKVPRHDTRFHLRVYTCPGSLVSDRFCTLGLTFNFCVKCCFVFDIFTLPVKARPNFFPAPIPIFNNPFRLT